MTASRTPPVPATTDTSPAPIDAAALRQSWDHVCRYGDQVPLSFYSSLFLAHPLHPGHVPGEHGRPARAAGRRLVGAQARADHAADAAVHGYRARAGDAYTPQFEELARRLTWARTFVTSLESVEVQLRTAREALAYEFDRLGDAGPAPGP
jgi:hypothetical protein